MNIEEHRMTTEPVEKIEKVFLNNSNLEQTTKIGTFASPAVHQALTTFLKSNRDEFAWNHKDMPRIDPLVMVHRLNVSPSFSPIRQKKRVFTPKQDRAIVKEVRKL